MRTIIFHLTQRTNSKPEAFQEMLRIARILSQGFPHVRVDFYYVNKTIIFVELTFFHNGGLVGFKPDKMNYELGDKIILPLKNDAWGEFRKDFLVNGFLAVLKYKVGDYLTCTV